MWYRVEVAGERKYINDVRLAELKADGVEFKIETKNKWLNGVVNELMMGRDYWLQTRAEDTLEDVINLIDEGECDA